MSNFPLNSTPHIQKLSCMAEARSLYIFLFGCFSSIRLLAAMPIAPRLGKLLVLGLGRGVPYLTAVFDTIRSIIVWAGTQVLAAMNDPQTETGFENGLCTI